MDFKKLLAGGLVAAMSVSTLSGCATTSSGGAESLTINTQTEPPELNSVLTTSSGSMDVLRQCMDGLVILDANNDAKPGAAASWDEVTNDDGTVTYTFHMQENGVWSNGTPVTAADFEFALDLLFNPAYGAAYAGTWAPYFVGAEDMMAALNADTGELDQAAYDAAVATKGWDAVDDKTFTITTTSSYPFFIKLLAFVNFLPVNQAFYEEVGADNYAKDADKLIYNGAFNITEWQHEDHITFAKSDTYWDADAINLKGATFRMIKDDNTSKNEFVAGNLDETPVSGEVASQLKEQGYDIMNYSDGSSWYLEFNCNLPGTNNAKVRKALTLGVDAQSFIDNIVQNESVVATSFTPAAIANGEFKELVGDLTVRSTDYTEAKALLEEGLAEEGMTAADLNLVMIADDTTSAQKYATFIQEQLKTNLGVQITINSMPYKSRIAAMQSGDFSLVFAGWGPDYDDPMTFLDLFYSTSGNNHGGYASTQYDALVDAAKAELDVDARNDIMVQIEQLIATDYPIGVIYQRSVSYVQSDAADGLVRKAFNDVNIRYVK